MNRVFIAGVLALLLAAACTRDPNPGSAGIQTDSTALAKTEEIVSKDAVDSTGYIFRKTRWGMTQKEVVASEGIRPRLLDETVMIYATTWRNHPAEITYYFDKGLLGMAEYSISRPGMRMGEYAELYDDLRLQMIGKYGKPSLDDFGKRGFSRIKAGNSFVFKNSPTFWNRLANWELRDRKTEILLYLGYSTARDDSTQSCDVQYKSDSFNIEKLTGGSW